MAYLSEFIDPGELDRKITIQRASGAQDAYGEGLNVWYDLAEVWAKVEWNTKNNSEGEGASQIVQRDVISFTVRHRDVTARDRVKYRDDYYDIEGVAEMGGRNRFKVLTTKLYDS
jgi:SPP1 family predicted phage head-tail adaptor